MPFTLMEFFIQQTLQTSGGTVIGTTVMLFHSLILILLENMLLPSTDLKIAVTETLISNTLSTPTTAPLWETTAHKELCAPLLNLDIMILVT